MFVIDESKCLDIPIWELSIILEHLPFLPGYKQILHQLLVLRKLAHVVLLTITATSCRVACSLHAIAPLQSSWTPWHNFHPSCSPPRSPRPQPRGPDALRGSQFQAHLCNLVSQCAELHIDFFLKLRQPHVNSAFDYLH